MTAVTAEDGPTAVTSPAWAIGVILVAMVLEGLSLRTTVRQARVSDARSSWHYIRGTKTPETAVVLLKDTGQVFIEADTGRRRRVGPQARTKE